MLEVKRTDRWGLLAKVEATYGTAETLSDSADGVLALEEPVPDFQHAHDGSRRGDRAPGSGLLLPRVAKSGRFGELAVGAEAAGAAAAYSATDKPNVLALLRACGLLSTLDATVGLENYTLTPRSSGFESVTMRSYVRGEQYDMRGCMGSLGISFDGPEVPKWDFEMKGIGSSVPSDLAIPAITYPSVDPPKATNIALSFGTFVAAVVRGATFSQNAEIVPRLDANLADGHAGFALRHGDPTLEVTIEASSLVASPYHTTAGINPLELIERGTPLAVTLGPIGGTDYNKFTLNLLQAQLDDFDPGDDGPTGLWVLTFKAPVSGAAGTTDWNLVFDK